LKASIIEDFERVVEKEFDRVIERQRKWWTQKPKNYTCEEDDQEVGKRHREALREITTK